MFSRSIFKNPTLPASPPLRFPQKLWKIANECQSGAVCWSPDGKSILLRYSLFREEFMSTKRDLFKTDNISSFVRQLNLYGFRKVYDHAHKQAYKANPDLHEFSNAFFQRDKPDLLDKVTRKSGILKERNELWPDSHKSVDFSNKSSYDKHESMPKSVEANDHSYLCSQNNVPSNKPLFFSKFEEKATKMAQTIQKNEKIPVVSNGKLPGRESQVPDVWDQNAPLLPVKKKRGRKPGRKNVQFQPSSCLINNNQNIYYSPTLKNPENFPNLMYYTDDDEDDHIYLRNTSRDVMLSSTLPFQETPEHRTLKETYYRMYYQKMAARYRSLQLNKDNFMFRK